MFFVIPLAPSVLLLYAFWILVALSAHYESRVTPGLSRNRELSASGECPAYTIISARGTTELQTRPMGCSGFIKGVLSTVPGGKNYEVVYPAAPEFMMGPITASNDIIRYVESLTKRCPDQPFILIGYSQGAMGVVRALTRNEMQNKNVVAVIMYGNPYRTPGAPENAGTATGGRGVAAIGGVRLPRRYQSITLDICLLGDMVCTGMGSIFAHLRYNGSPQQKQAVNFAVKNLQGQGRLEEIESD